MNPAGGDPQPTVVLNKSVWEDMFEAQIRFGGFSWRMSRVDNWLQTTPYAGIGPMLHRLIGAYHNADWGKANDTSVGVDR